MISALSLPIDGPRLCRYWLQILRCGPNVMDLAVLVVRSVTMRSLFSLTSYFFGYQLVADFHRVPFRLFLGARLERNG